MTTLASPWTFYGFEPAPPESGEPYETQIKRIAKVTTGEEFWAVFSHMKRPSYLSNQRALHIFRGDSRAMREDPDQINGGSFLVRVSRVLADYYWESLCTNLVCGNMDPDVVGAIISAKQNYYNIYFWHQTAGDEELRMRICSQFCTLLHLPIGIRIDYTSHQNVLSSGEGDKHTVHLIWEVSGPEPIDIPSRETPKAGEEKPASE